MFCIGFHSSIPRLPVTEGYWRRLREGEAEGVDLDAKLSAMPLSLSRTKGKTREEVENVYLSSKVTGEVVELK